MREGRRSAHHAQQRKRTSFAQENLTVAQFSIMPRSLRCLWRDLSVGVTTVAIRVAPDPSRGSYPSVSRHGSGVWNAPLRSETGFPTPCQWLLERGNSECDRVRRIFHHTVPAWAPEPPIHKVRGLPGRIVNRLRFPGNRFDCVTPSWRCPRLEQSNVPRLGGRDVADGLERASGILP